MTENSASTSHVVSCEPFSATESRKARSGRQERERVHHWYLGSAGAGKSFLVAQLLEMLVAKLGASAVAATAPTAVAARLLPGGMTLASFAGYGPPREESDVDLTRLVTKSWRAHPHRNVGSRRRRW